MAVTTTTLKKRLCTITGRINEYRAAKDWKRLEVAQAEYMRVLGILKAWEAEAQTKN